MELNHLRYFYEVAKSGSFTEAARRLHISQSALSKAVALLEDAEGVQLFQRSKQGVVLTSVGSEVFQKSEAIFQTVIEIQNTCRGTQETCEGILRFGASDHVTNYLLVSKIREMREKHPLVTPSVFSGTPNEITAAILSNEIEFGLFFTKLNIPQIIYEPLFEIEMAVVCHPKLIPDLKAGQSVARLRTALRETGFIGSIHSQYQTHPSQDFMDLMGDQPNIGFESNSQETQKRLCIEGGGVAFLARFMVEKELKKGSLVEVTLVKPLKLSLHLARRKSRPLSVSAKTFVELL
jgi:DNA-binding transcriptional LysR family regulator